MLNRLRTGSVFGKAEPCEVWLERVSFWGGLGATALGAFLASAIMIYRAIDPGIHYTFDSWFAIPALWGGVAGLWVASWYWAYWLGGLAVLLGAFAGLYFSDVYGQYVLALFMAFVMIRALSESSD